MPPWPLLLLPCLSAALERTPCDRIDNGAPGLSFLCLGDARHGLVRFATPPLPPGRLLRLSAECLAPDMVFSGRLILGLGDERHGRRIVEGRELHCRSAEQENVAFLTVLMPRDAAVVCWLHAGFADEPVPFRNFTRKEDALQGRAPYEHPRFGWEELTALNFPQEARLHVEGDVAQSGFRWSTFRLHVLPGEHFCFRELEARCKSLQELAECVAKSRKGQHSLAFEKAAKLNLGSHSQPKIDGGMGYVLVTCHGGCGLPMQVTLLAAPLKPVLGKILEGAAFMVVVPLLAIAAAGLLRMGCTETAIVSAGSIWEVGRRQLVEVAKAKEQWRLGAGLALMGCASLASTLQFVVARWQKMIWSGDRDICYYNDACYVPFWGFDLPFNKMLSHLPYFVCSAGLMLAVLQTEIAWRRLAATAQTPKALDLSTFYALAVAIGLEGLGSTFYHLCPHLVVFQFDTAFMVPIAHLSSFALLDNDDDEEGQGRVPSAYQYLAFCMSPLWLLNYLGSESDEGKLLKLPSLIFFLAGGSWFWLLTQRLLRLLPAGFPKILALAVQWSMRAAVCRALLVPSWRTEHFGGFANLVLELSIGAMFLLAFAQMAAYDRPAASGRMAVIVAKLVVRFTFEALCFLAGNLAMRAFTSRATDVLAEPKVSRSMNKACEVLGVFDSHDVWHLLSAVALQLWVMCLLNAKLRIWRRRVGCAEA